MTNANTSEERLPYFISICLSFLIYIFAPAFQIYVQWSWSDNGNLNVGSM